MFAHLFEELCAVLDVGVIETYDHIALFDACFLGRATVGDFFYVNALGGGCDFLVFSFFGGEFGELDTEYRALH